jgi:hypothetical protein
MRTKPFVLLGVLGLSACLGLVYDLEVHWTVSGSTSSSACATYNIQTWRVTLSNGPDLVTPETFACGTSWDTGLSLHALAEGYYDVNVEALNAGGTVIAQQGLKHVFVGAGALDADPSSGIIDVDVNFTANDFITTSSCGNGVCESSKGETPSSCPADCATTSCNNNGICESGETCTSCPGDCGSCTGAKINFYWNINGTVDGSDKGESWDTCDEVGCSKVRVIVDGATTEFPCAGTVPGKMSGSVSASAGGHSVVMRLLDGSGNAITSDATASVTATTAGGEFYGDFYFNSFTTIKNTMIGDYLFTTKYEGKSCTQTSPQVYSQLTLLKLNGSAVSPAPKVCGPDNVCVVADGAAFGQCYGANETQEIRDVKWGFYKIKLQGTLSQADGYEICWEDKNDGKQYPEPWPLKDDSNEVDILVGAGTTNPILAHDLTRISSTGFCTP